MKIVLSDNENGTDGLVLSMMGMRYYYELINKPIFVYIEIYENNMYKRRQLVNFDYEPNQEENIIIYSSENPFNPFKVIYDTSFERHDPILIKVVEELGPILSSSNGKLRIVEIPDNIEYRIQFEHDWAGGPEYAEEKFPKPREWR